MMNLLGYELALIEVSIFFFISYTLKNLLHNLRKINCLTYYWSMFTILTGFWELSFIKNYNQVYNVSTQLIHNKEHVWENKYSLDVLRPDKFSIIFYSEYAAWADREYMLKNDDWSRVIEGSHCLMCGLACLMAFLFIIRNNLLEYYFITGIAMGSQLMNSVLYLVNYFHQTRDTTNINYITEKFPCGNLLQHRLFMYVNVLWFLMPSIIIYNFILSLNSRREYIIYSK
jgi:hypothetical protein